MGRHGGRGITAAIMAGGCLVYLLLPTYIMCQVSVVQKKFVNAESRILLT